MNTIRVVEDRMYHYSQPVPIPKGQVRFSQIQFLFSEDWYGKHKIAQFEQGEALYNQDIVDGSCIVPAELEVGPCVLYVKGYNLDGSEQIATANGVVLTLVQGAREGGTPAVPPPPDLYATLLVKVDNTLEKAVPIIRDKMWWVWSSVEGDYVNTGIRAEGAETEPVADVELLSAMRETDLIDPVVDEAGSFIVDNNGSLFIL